MANFQSNLFKNFVKGLNSSVDRYNQPQGSFPRGSNLLLSKRGSLTTCDGSKIIEAFNGVPTPSRGKAMCEFLFAPTGVSRYFLRILKALDQPLGFPQNFLASDGGAGGTLLPNTTYEYAATALDGAGGESGYIFLGGINSSFTTPGVAHKITLTWNVVPNAVSYNVYRRIPGTPFTPLPKLLSASNLPVSQVPFGTLTVSYTDDGSGTQTMTAQTDLITMQPNNQATFALSGFFPTQGTIAFFPVGCQFLCQFPTDIRFSGFWQVVAVVGTNSILCTPLPPLDTTTIPIGTQSTGGSVTLSPINLPNTDTTQQTALYSMPQAGAGIRYDNSRIVALFPADPYVLDGGVGGGAGGGGGTGGGAPGQQGSTPSGGLPSTVRRTIPGNVSFIPEIVQFANQAAIALGNAFPPQVYRDNNGTPTNPAINCVISAISVDVNGVVTITTSTAHGIDPTQGVGACVYIQGVPVAGYNTSAAGSHAFVTISIPSATQVKVVNLNAIGNGPSAGGVLTATTIPFISTFTNPYPSWATGITYLVGDIITPVAANGHYYKAVQGGISSAAAPAFSTVSGAQFPDGSGSAIIWQEAGLTNSTAPPPSGAGHLKVFAGALWVWNTAVSNTSDGLDGPCVLRMSDVNNLNSWNPINQAFLDKDDGTEGMGISSFTIAGFGIPPEGSLVAFKNFAGYQIVGVFGSPNFLIQKIKSDLGCLAPRTLQFVTGYGLIRFSHLGFAVFDGINDRVVSEEIRPYLIPTNSIDTSDITVIDYNWMPISQGTQTASPPMYVCAMPIGNSLGKLTRIFCYDLVLKAWAAPVDLPFAISTLYQARAVTTIPITVMGTFNDGCLHRWQAGDNLWDASIDSGIPKKVSWSAETPMVFNQRSQGGRVYCRQFVTRGKATDPTYTALVSLKIQGEPSIAALTAPYNLGSDGTFHLITAVDEKFTNLSVVVSGTGAVELQAFDPQTVDLTARTPPRLT